MSLESYLAQNYLKDPAREKKKKKRASKNSEVDSTVQDNNTNRITRKRKGTEAENVSTNASIKKPYAIKGWKSIETNEMVDSSRKLMEDGSYAGLQTKEELRESMQSKRDKFDAEKAAAKESLNGQPSETIHRDSTGKVIDKSVPVQTEDDRKSEEKKQKKLEMKKTNKSEYESLKRQEELQKLQDMKSESLNTYENDQKLNESQKKVIKEEDPALMFNASIKKQKKKNNNLSVTGRKLFEGPFTENRFGIRPGWRWDGVDRSSGFENRWFARQAEAKENETLRYTLEKDV